MPSLETPHSALEKPVTPKFELVLLKLETLRSRSFLAVVYGFYYYLFS
jgi:hypothetical protein